MMVVSPAIRLQVTKEAVSIVRNDMLTLNKIVVDSFQNTAYQPNHFHLINGQKILGVIFLEMSNLCSILILM